MDKKLYVELPPFTGRNVPIAEIAKAIGKDPHYIRLGIQQGVLKFGVAIKMEMNSIISVRTERYGKKRDISKQKRRIRQKKKPLHKQGQIPKSFATLSHK